LPLLTYLFGTSKSCAYTKIFYCLFFPLLWLDYARKAENAVDYEDIQEEYDGPEVQVPVQDQQFYAQAALAVPLEKPGSFVADEDNYDEDEQDDEEKREEPEDVPITSTLSPKPGKVFYVRKD
jgi:hypothetical protein